MRRMLSAGLLALFVCVSVSARERICLDDGWHFAFGSASSPEADFGRGTEYFTYLTKAASIHNVGPYSPAFQEDALLWKEVSLPHDFAMELPFSEEASHSHGYKAIGWKYPESSVGWYRRGFFLGNGDKGKNIRLQFDGIFREGEVWVNGIWLGRKASGYISHDYDITPYLFYDGRENLICVRCDASFEEGWFYEGAGIYRHAWLQKTGPLHIASDGIFVHSTLDVAYRNAVVTVEAEVQNDGPRVEAYTLEYELFSPAGELVAQSRSVCGGLATRACGRTETALEVGDAELWSPDSPSLYTLKVGVLTDGVRSDDYLVRTGLREIFFDPDKGMFLNGRPLKIKGFNMHQDHAGVGVAIPDGLQRYRLSRLKDLGANAYRSSHNPMTPEMLDACDEMGILVLEENRLLGINPAQMDVAEDMVRRGRNHPCVFCWSVGNEEWGLEWDERSVDIARTMAERIKLTDPTRPVSAASSSGPHILLGVDIAGYNYMMQHPIDSLRKLYPSRVALGSEETTGCGTRGVYFNEIPLPGEGDEYERFLAANPSGRMPAMNRFPDRDGSLNRIERGWKFYDSRDWLAGAFFWTGFDYRGEPNPLAFPATGSEFGVLDWCGFPKDEAWYLKAWWKPSEPLLHILPHWNLPGHEGEIIPVWVYGNSEEVELRVNGRSFGRKPMPRGGHLCWEVEYKPGRIEAIGYNGGKVVARETVRTAGVPSSAVWDEQVFGDIHIVDISVLDSRGVFVPDACIELEVALGEGHKVLGWGNGDPAFRRDGDPTVCTFNGHAQIIIQSESDRTDIDIRLK